MSRTPGWRWLNPLGTLSALLGQRAFNTIQYIQPARADVASHGIYLNHSSIQFNLGDHPAGAPRIFPGNGDGQRMPGIQAPCPCPSHFPHPHRPIPTRAIQRSSDDGMTLIQPHRATPREIKSLYHLTRNQVINMHREPCMYSYSTHAINAHYGCPPTNFTTFLASCYP